MSHMQGVLIVLPVGVGLALMVMMAETALERKWKIKGKMCRQNIASDAERHSI